MESTWRARCWLVAVAWVTSTGCDDAPTTAECDTLFAHIATLINEDRGSSDSKGAPAAPAQVPAETRDYCLRALPRQQLRCGLAARSMDELRRCDDFGNQP